MEKKKIENLYCLIEALYDVKDAFKAIVFLTCAVFIIWYSSVIVSRAFAIALFVVLACCGSVSTKRLLRKALFLLKRLRKKTRITRRDADVCTSTVHCTEIPAIFYYQQ